ncbi:hypothetical protein [Candidatus Thiodiazotropha sp. CDECU1]|uniref:hypothetical protein n=1 Tax=Candidatus Thiodiazotropha sp. CDECU1 TaxID=3065865 RepID=UPI002930504A|nr:hypothetical protein [Candidatus Thiodiazotropha sp. CDECU1]
MKSLDTAKDVDELRSSHSSIYCKKPYNQRIQSQPRELERNFPDHADLLYSICLEATYAAFKRRNHIWIGGLLKFFIEELVEEKNRKSLFSTRLKDNQLNRDTLRRLNNQGVGAPRLLAFLCVISDLCDVSLKNLVERFVKFCLEKYRGKVFTNNPAFHRDNRKIYAAKHSDFQGDGRLIAMEIKNRWDRQNRKDIVGTDVNHNQLTLFLGKRDTYVCIIDGDGESEIDPNNIFCKLTQEPVIPPSELEGDIAKITEEAETNPDVWNGKTIHVKGFTVTRSKVLEYSKLHLELQIGQYFHHMSVNSRLFREYREHGMDTPFRKRLTKGFDEWRTRAFTYGINVLYIGLFVLTKENNDKKVIFARRSKKAGIDPGVICYTVNENMHPEKDVDHVNAGMLSVNRLLERSLPEELGWKDSDHHKKHDTKLLVFNVNLGGITYGLMGYTQLPITYSEFQKMFAANAKDRMEVEGFIAVDCELGALCEFVHENNLYDHTGMGVFYLLRNQGYTTREINDCFFQLQENA